MILTFDYDTSYNPSAPIIEIGIGASDGTPPKVKVQALIDTGSDASMFPLELLKRAGGRFVRRRAIRGVTGERLAVNLYLIAVHVASHTIYGIQAAASPDSNETILGRDVLNHLTTTLDGPGMSVEIRL
ncbi:MAG: hypothetical protein U0175_28650 [Caldilineaceae bacterium]